MDESVFTELEHFLTDSSQESFLRLRKVFATSPEYAPYGTSLNRIDPFMSARDYPKVQTILQTLVPSYFLNPGVHLLYSFVLHKLGDESRARVEFELGERLMEGILSSGSGSENSPYLVLYTNDEYDVLERQERKSCAQFLVQDDYRALDHHQCECGTDVWFDITVQMSYLARRFPKTGI